MTFAAACGLASIFMLYGRKGSAGNVAMAV